MHLKNTATSLFVVIYGHTALASTGTGSIQDGCPEEYDSDAIYEANESISVRNDGISIIYTCKPFPESQWCSHDTYSPVNTQQLCNGDACWPQAWNKVGPCEGANTPTFDAANVSLSGCPEKYETRYAYKYREGDEVSVTPAGEDYGKMYKCKAWPMGQFCVKDIYSPANTKKQCNGEVCWPEAWTYEGSCYGTIPPTDAPTQLQLSPNTDISKELCQFKKVVETASYGEYVVLQAESWVWNTCEDVVSAGDTNGDEDEFNPATGGPVFASNGDMLVNADGYCLNAAINPEDYFKPGVEGCSEFKPSSEPSSVPSMQPSKSAQQPSEPSSDNTTSNEPTHQPTMLPPVAVLSNPPTSPPSPQPTNAVTSTPTKYPTPQPTFPPTPLPITSPPTLARNTKPHIIAVPSNPSTSPPTLQPTDVVTSTPTKNPTPQPTSSPTPLPITSSPTSAPKTQPPVAVPSNPPTSPPSPQPTDVVTSALTKNPTPQPTSSPGPLPITSSPTLARNTKPHIIAVPSNPSTSPPTLRPTDVVTSTPTKNPTPQPTSSPMPLPITSSPTSAPKTHPTFPPTFPPTPPPTTAPVTSTSAPTPAPSKVPVTPLPTNNPTPQPISSSISPAATTAPSTPPPTAAPSPPGAILFDEFAPNLFDSAVWQPRVPLSTYGAAATTGVYIPEAHDDSGATLLYPANRPVGEWGPAYSTQIKSTDMNLYGNYEARLKSGRANAGEGVISAFFIYFNDEVDYDGDGIHDNHEIDFELLNSDRSSIWCSVYTDYQYVNDVHTFHRNSARINVATGEVWATIPGNEGNWDLVQVDSLDWSVPGFDHSASFYTYGFEWSEDKVTFWIDLEDGFGRRQLFEVLSDGSGGPNDHIPNMPAATFFNLWHTYVDWFSRADAPPMSIDTVMEIDYVKVTPVSTTSSEPTHQPTTKPPVVVPSNPPTSPPTPQPTNAVTSAPTKYPTPQPSSSPTPLPITSSPTLAPKTQPPTAVPSNTSTSPPSPQPTNAVTSAPTKYPTPQPSSSPTPLPITSSPTLAPKTQPPTAVPSNPPTSPPTLQPTDVVTSAPTKNPTPQPTFPPTPLSITSSPTLAPKTQPPTAVPSNPSTSNVVTPAPTKNPTPQPTPLVARVAKFVCAKYEPVPSMICSEGSVASGKYCTTEGRLDGCGKGKKCWWNEECPAGDVGNCSARGAYCSQNNDCCSGYCRRRGKRRYRCK